MRVRAEDNIRLGRGVYAEGVEDVGGFAGRGAAEVPGGREGDGGDESAEGEVVFDVGGDGGVEDACGGDDEECAGGGDLEVHGLP